MSKTAKKEESEKVYELETELSVLLSATSLIINRSLPFFACILNSTEIKIVEPKEDQPVRDAPAWTDGIDIYINPPAFVEHIVERNKDMEKAEFKCFGFMVLHELLHCVFLHAIRKGEKNNHKAWNIACDVAINNFILNTMPKLGKPKGICYNTDFIKGVPPMHHPEQYSSEQIYQHIMKHAPKDPNGGGACSVELDPGEGMAPGTGDDLDEPSKSGKDPEDVKDNMARKVATAENLGESIEKDLREAGNSSSSFASELLELFEPQVDWRDLLSHVASEIAHNDYTFRQQSKASIVADYYLPKAYSEEAFVIVAVDTSGSVSMREFQNFLSEVSGMLDVYGTKVGVMHCDTEVSLYEEYDGDSSDRPRSRSGCGGTYFKPVFDYIKDKELTPGAVIYFTDGYNADTNFEENVDLECPILWIMTTDHDAPKIGTSARYHPK